MSLGLYRPDSEDKRRAKGIVARAIWKGQITRPVACQQCGKQPPNALHGHHEDYSKPLDVQWLCASCHHQLHRNALAISGPHKQVSIWIPQSLRIRLKHFGTDHMRSMGSVAIEAMTQYLDKRGV